MAFEYICSLSKYSAAAAAAVALKIEIKVESKLWKF